MTVPASIHQAARRRVALIVEREYAPDPARCVAAIVKLLTYRPSVPPGDHDSADDACWPLGAGDQLQTHEATPSPTKSRRRFEEDDHRDALT